MNRTNHLFVKIGYYSFLACALFLMFYGLKELFIPLVLGVLITFVFEPVVDRMEMKLGSRMKSVLTLYFILGVVLAGVGAFVFPQIVTQLETIVESLPVFKEKLYQQVVQLETMLQERFPESNIPDLWNEILGLTGADKSVSVGKAAVSYVSQFLSVFSVLLFAPVISFFLLLDGARFQKHIFHLVPNRYFEMSMLLFHKIVSSLKSFLRGQVIDALAVGVLTAIGLSLIKLPYGIIIGLVAGVANLIPYLGPIIGFIPGALVLLGQEGTTAFSFIPLVAVFFGVQFFEGTFIYPLAVGKSVNLHPLIVMLAITLGGQVAGLPGMLLVIPLISMIKVSFEVLNSYLKGYGII